MQKRKLEGMNEELRTILRVANLLEIYEFFEKNERRQLHKKKMMHIIKN